jgi:hypothetical protein
MNKQLSISALADEPGQAKTGSTMKANHRNHRKMTDCPTMVKAELQINPEQYEAYFVDLIGGS